MPSTFGDNAIRSVLAKFLITLTLSRRHAKLNICYRLGITAHSLNNKRHIEHKARRLLLARRKEREDTSMLPGGFEPPLFAITNDWSLFTFGSTETSFSICIHYFFLIKISIFKLHNLSLIKMTT